MKQLSILGILLLLVFFCVTPSHAELTNKRQIGQLLLENIPVREGVFRVKMKNYLSVRPTYLQSLADDSETILITTRFGDTMQLHIVNQPMGMRQQITFFDQPILGASFVPGSKGRCLIFSQDSDGYENWQLYHLDLKTGQTTLLTDGKSRHESPVLSHDGRLLAFCGSGRNGRDFDIYLCDLTNAKTTKLLLQAKGMLIPIEFSPDNTKLLVQKYVSERETQFFIVSVTNGTVARITPHPSQCFYGGGAWGLDGKTIYLLSDRDGEFRKLYKVNLETNVWQCLSSDIEWDVEEVKVNTAGRGIVFTTNEDGISRLYFADLDGANRKSIKLPADVVKISGLISSRGDELGFTLIGSTSPPDAYTVGFSNGEIRQWTRGEIGGLNPDNFVTAEMIRYPTFDQKDGQSRMISAFIFRGRGRGPRPVVIHAHGGPEFQYQPVFNGEFQYWANELGITVISPNVRGSTGYGRSFHQLDNDIKREDAVRDIGALLDWIARQPDLDSGHIGAFGGSYGGYLVLNSLTNYPGRIACGIDVAGIADITAFLENTAEYRRNLRRVEYGDERDPLVRKTLDAISPLRHVDKIHAALFVMHGKQDTRVPIHEAEQIVAKMREMKRPVWFATALEEGHNFLSRQSRDLEAILSAMFWQEYLLTKVNCTK